MRKFRTAPLKLGDFGRYTNEAATQTDLVGERDYDSRVVALQTIDIIVVGYKY